MIGIELRIVLIVMAFFTFAFMVRYIRKSKVKIEDTFFWIIFSGIIIIASVFPQIFFWAADLIGISAPINFVLLFIIFLMILKMYTLTLKVSMLELKIIELTQNIAIKENQNNSSEKGKENV